MGQRAETVLILTCTNCGSAPICDRDFEMGKYSATCGNVDCSERYIIDGLKVTRLQALQAWNKRNRVKTENNTKAIK